MDANIIKLAESILSDITSDASIANILLKSKVVASKLQDKDLLKWVSEELNGYTENLPEYRIIGANVKVDIHRGFQEVLNYTYPIDMIRDERIRKRVSRIPVHNSITQIEEMMKEKKTGTLHMDLPTAIWYNHMRHCISGEIQRAYQVASVSSLSNIIVAVKSLLIDYFLKISENENIQFSSLIKKDATMTINNINASIVNAGNGTINAENTTTVIGDHNRIDTSLKNELLDLIRKIDGIMESVEDDEYKELSMDIASELNKETPSKKVLKRCFQAIGGLLSGVASGIVANQITPLINSALSLLK